MEIYLSPVDTRLGPRLILLVTEDIDRSDLVSVYVKKIELGQETPLHVTVSTCNYVNPNRCLSLS